MNIKEIFEILNINETKDEELIKQAYRKELVKYNPEDDPEGFKRLRQAYNEAVEYAKSSDEEDDSPKSEIDLWILKVKELYENISRRISIDEWNVILEDEVCEALDFEDEAKEKLLVFFMDHSMIPHVVWECLDKRFGYVEDKEKLYEKFPRNYIDFVVNQVTYEDFVDYDLFSGPEKGDYDSLISTIFTLKEQYDKLEETEGVRDYSEIDKILGDVANMEVYHPICDAIKMLVEILRENKDVVFELMNELKNGFGEFTGKEYSSNYYVKYCISKAMNYMDMKEEAHALRREILDDRPLFKMAMLDEVYYLFEKGEYKEAKEASINVLDNFGYYPKAIDMMKKANDELMNQYRNKALNEGDVESFFDLAWCYYQNEMFRECITWLLSDKKMQEGENEFDFSNITGRCYLSMEKYEKALPYLLKWTQMIDELVDDGTEKYSKRIKRRGYSNYITGMCYYGMADNLKKELKKEFKSNKDTQKVEVIIRENYEKAVEFIQKGIDVEESVKEKVMFRDRMAYVLYNMGEYKRCIDWCNEFINEIPQYYNAYVFRQQSFYELGYAREVIDDYYNAIAIYSDDSTPYELAARVFYDYDKYEDMERVLNTAKERNVTSEELELLNIIYVWKTSSEDMDKLAACVNRLSRLEEEFINEKKECYFYDTSEILFVTGLVLLDMGNKDRAFNYLERTKAYDSKRKVDVNWVFANVYRENGETKKEREVLKEIEKITPNDIEVWYRIGVCDWYMDNDDSAKAYFDKVYEQDDKHYLVNAFLADYYLYMYKNDLDEEKYEKALKHSQYQCEIIDSANHFVRRAKIYMEKKLLLKAREALNIAMEKDENYPDIYYNMAVTYVYDGDFNKAIEYYNKALETGVEMYQAPQRVLYGGLINAYCCIQEPDKANKILEMSGEENNEWYFKKRELIAKKKYGYSSMKLAKVYKEWVEACGYNEYATEALIGIAKIYILKDDYKSAQKYIKQAIKCANNNADKLCDIYISLGETIYEDKRDFKRAMKYFKEAITYDKKTNGENARLYLWMAAIYAESGKTKDAKKFYEDFDGECAKHYGSVKNYINSPDSKRARLYGLGCFYIAMKDKDKLKKCIESMSESYVCPFCTFGECFELLILKAGLCELEYDYRKAMEYLQEASKASNQMAMVELLKDNVKKKFKS